MKTKIMSMFNYLLLFISGYLILGLVIHHFILPEKKIDLSAYFKPNQSFSSKLEGLTQRVIKLENNILVTEINFNPKASGPVAHIHEHFDEKFTVKQGTLSMIIGNQTKLLTAGQQIIIPKNTVHKPFNISNEWVIVESEMPASFGYCLSQIYPFWDEDPSHVVPPKILFQLAAFGSNFDSYPTENAPPKPVLKLLKFILAPTARLMGYKNYKEKYQPKPL